MCPWGILWVIIGAVLFAVGALWVSFPIFWVSFGGCLAVILISMLNCFWYLLGSFGCRWISLYAVRVLANIVDCPRALMHGSIFIYHFFFSLGLIRFFRASRFQKKLRKIIVKTIVCVCLKLIVFIVFP